MEIKSFMSGMLVLIAAGIILPLLGVKISVVIPFGTLGSIAAAVVALVAAYYLLRM